MQEPCAPVAGYITNYLNTNTADGCLDGLGLIDADKANHARATYFIARSASMSSFIYGSPATASPTSTQLSGIGGNPPVRIISQSAGFECTAMGCTGNYDEVDRDADNYVYFTSVPFFKSAGNQGASNGFITSPGRALNLITIGNYMDSDPPAGSPAWTIRGTSSFVDPPNTKNMKPEFSGPGSNISAGTNINNTANAVASGTSYSAPHLAGIAADLTQAYTAAVLRPDIVRADFMVGAIDGIAPDRAHVGFNGVDALSAAYNNTWFWWATFNTDWVNLCNNDGIPDDALSVDVAVTGGNYNAFALSWFTRGTYTYAHKADAHPIGADFDITVTNLATGQLWSSASFDDPFELIAFFAPSSGTYRVRIRRVTNRDTASIAKLALVHKYW